DNVSSWDEGSVQVMYGSSTGPSVVSPDDEFWSAGLTSSIAGTFDNDNFCGSALAVDDFDDDGFDDLAIGCPGYDVPVSGGGTASFAGAVLRGYGSGTRGDAARVL